MKPRISILLFLLFSTLVFCQDWSKIHPTGVRQMTPEEEARIRPKMFRITEPQTTVKTPLPTSVKNITYLPVVTSQGGIGSCAAYATCYYMKTYQEAKENGWIRPDPSINPERIASPAWGYNVAVRVPSYNDLAVSHYKVADNICEYGIASWAEMPYSGDPQTYQWDAWPSEEVWRRGIQWRAQQAGVIYIHSHEGLEALKEHIAGGNLAVITTHVYSNFDQYPNGEYTNNDVLYAYTTTGYRGGHALTVVGYDDNKQYFDAIEGKNKKGAFLCVNSWGTNWGVFVPEAGSAGFIWLPYDFFLQKKNGDPEALILIDRINYHPEITATIGINHTRGRKLLLRIYAGEKNYPGYPAENKRWVKDAMPVSNDYPLQNSRIVVDLTDFADYENLTWYLEIMQLQMYSGTGEINYFAIQKGNKLPIESASVPQSPQTNWYIWLKAGLFSDAGDIFGSLKVRRGSIAWADFNKDGKVDLLITGYDWKTGSAVPVTFLFINRGDGTFQQAITANLPQLGNSIIACADYDNDSYPDVAIYGYNPQTDSNILKIYRNNGNNTFSDTAINLSHQEIIDMCWIDYDNDGKMDLTLSTENNVFLYKNCGNNNFGLYVQPLEITGSLSCADYDKDGWIDLLVSGTYKTAIYKNTGDGIFVETYSNFPGLRQASIAWADYDNDGNIDLALSGRLEDYTPFTGIYKNNGNNNFTYVETQITPVFAGSIVFADINNDGYRDLVMTGRTEDEFSTRYLGNYPNCSIVYLNDRHGNFFNAMAELLGVSIADMTCIPDYNNTLAVIDYDNDGDNDIFLSGTNTYMYTTTPSHIYTGIQKSLIANNEWDISNTPAQPPSNLSAIAGWENGSIVLQWQPGTDSETPSAGLYYHVRVGTATGSDNIVSSINGLIYPGQVILQDTKFLLTGLAPGTYYWSVQTIDAGMKVSAWSAESSFVIPSYTQKYNLHISSQQPYFGTTNPSPGVYSYNSGTNVQISAIPYGGYTFSRWSGDIENTQQNPVNVNMNRPRIITANFTLLYDISPQWEQKIDYTPWGSAQFHSTVVFNNNIWVLGGYNGNSRTNAIWSSSDGTNWSQATTSNIWTPRIGHSAVVFNNKIWVLGGYDATGYLNDVWSSSDGTNWSCVLTNAPWSKRYSFGALVYDGKIWVLGGKGVSGWLNDVWSSSDGINWFQATSSASWQPREGLASVVFDNKMWVIGGYQGPVNSASDVWYSTNGSTWTSATTSANWAPRYQHTTVVFDNRIWMLGGIVRDNNGNWLNATNEVWYSWDGIYWSPFDNATWQPRYGHTSFVFGNKIWVLGGSYSDIWAGSVPSTPSGALRLTVGTSSRESGTTIPQPGYYYDTSGKVFHLKAIPSYGYEFVNWTGDVANPNSEETTVTLNSNKVVVANFVKKNTYNLTLGISPSNSGSIIPLPGNYSYPEGTIVDIAARPSEGYVFSHWTGDVANASSQSTTVLVDSNKTITANFIPDPFAPNRIIDGGDGHTVMLLNEGTVWTWGLNSSGQLGNGSTDSSLIPVSYTVLESAKAVSAGISHTVALKTNGTVWAWGANNFGQIGNGTSQSMYTEPVPVSNLSGIIAISCGGYHTLALKNDGTVFAWGKNDSYQLGLGDTYGTNMSMPGQVVGQEGIGYLSRVKRISAGFAHNLVLKEDGSVWSWGNNNFGQLGTGNRTDSMYPVKIQQLSEITGIAAGGTGISGSHSLAVKQDGSVWSWGANNRGQLGDGTNVDKLVPVQVKGTGGTGFLSNIRQLAAGGKHSLALDSDGHVWAWGANNFGQLGDGTNNDSVYPVMVQGLPEIKNIAAGINYSIAIDHNGNVWMWGQNISGQFGSGTQTNSNIPVILETLRITDISYLITVSVSPANSGSTVPSGTRKYRKDTNARIIAKAGERYQFSHWSGEASGTETEILVLMDANKNVIANFVLIPGVKCKLTMVCSPAQAGYLIPEEGQHEFSAGSVVNILVIPGYRYNFTGWSNNVTNPSAMETSVRLDGDTTVTAYFQKQDFSTFPDISAGGQHNLVLKEDGTVWASGLNTQGQLGINSVVDEGGNLQVKGLDGIGYLSGIIRVCGGANHSVALSYDGTVYGWGLNTLGQLGDGTNTSPRYAAVKTKSPDGTGQLCGVTYISAGSSHTAAVKTDKTVWTWGNNNYGQLGNNSTTNTNLPVQVHGEMDRGFLTGVKSVACGPEHTLALLEDGTVVAWGRNHYGQLGNGTTQDSFVPVKVLNLTDIVAIDASDYAWGPPFSLALKRDGTVWAWGGGRDGQLGTGQSGEEYYSSIPVQVQSLTDVIAIAAGDFHALALKRDGTVWAWGSNSMGQCGDNTYDNIRTTPVQVKGVDGVGYLTDVIDISAGYTYSMAMKRDGTVWLWGMQQFLLFGGYQWTGLRYPAPVQRPYTNLDTTAQLVYLTMQVIPAGAGLTSPIESIHAYNPGTVVNIRAMANKDYVFSHWNTADNVFSPDTTVTMDQSKTVFAYFEKLLAQIGDINRNDAIDIQDVILALRMTLELPIEIGFQSEKSPYSNLRLESADINCDGEIDVTDVILILRHVLEFTTPVYDPYKSRTVVGPETTPESVLVNVNAGEKGQVGLSDGTGVILPATTTSYSIVLGRISNYIDIEQDLNLDPDEGLSPQTSGSLRTLQIDFDSVLSDTDKLSMIPVITIPRKEIGVLNPATVNILRISEQVIGGKIVKTHSLLPAHFDENGNLTTKDIYLAQQLLSMEVPPGTKGNAPIYISYIPLTFQGTINWAREAKFVRMVPDAKAKAKRKPIDALSDEEKQWELKKPIKNVVVLVHGHNEEEKTGLAGQFERNADFPWAVDYKQDVWTYLYETFIKDYSDFNSCTVFYEFIYPTWRPIFGHLDDMLVEKITSAFEKQLSYNLEDKDSFAFNLFIVAHSMGGVVSRAAIIKFPEVLDDQFKHFISWGSPHRGAAMYSLRYLLTSPAYEAKTTKGSLLSTAMATYVGNTVIDAPGIMDLRWTNGSPQARRFLQFDSYFQIKSAYQSQPNIYDLRTGSLLYNQRLQQLNDNDNRGSKYTFLYGITSQGVPIDEIDEMGLVDLVSVLKQGEIPIGATINRFLIENGYNVLHTRLESDSDGAVPIVSMTGLGLNPSLLIDVGDIDHEAYYHNADDARFVANRTFEALGFKTNPLYDPPEIEFISPADDDLLEAEQGIATITGKLHWKGPRKFEGGAVKEIKVFKYTFAYEFQHGFDWQGESVTTDEWNINNNGDFSVSCNIAEPEMVYALRIAIVFKDDTEMQGVVLLGCPDEYSTTAQGETMTWSIDGLGKIFKAEDDLYVYQKPKQGETPAVNIFASVIPVYRQQNSTFSTFAGMYSSTGGMPLDSVQNDVEWRIGLPEPTELNQMDISFSTYYDDNNLYAIAYSAVDMGEGGELVPYPDGGYFWSEGTPSIVKKVDVFLLPWIMHEKEELLPPYCRQQELPTEE